MAYTSWSVSFGEVPSASKWNILGTNDASFNDGTGFQDGVIASEKLNSTVGFYATTVQSIPNDSETNVTTYTEVVDYGSDFDPTTGTFTAPVNGFYCISAGVGFTNIGTDKRFLVRIKKNGSGVAAEQGSANTSLHDPAGGVTININLSATDTILMSAYQDSGGNLTIRATEGFLSGFLIGEV